MIPVSTEWKNAIKEQFRYQGYLRVSIEVTPPGLQENLQVTSPATDDVSKIDTTIDENAISPIPYATLEDRRWLLNGKYDILGEDTITDDWWSTPMTEGTKELVFTFNQAYTIPGIYVEWDVINGTYPTQLIVDGYNTGGTKQYSYEVTNISSATGFIDIPMDNVSKVVMTISEWSEPNWRARINEVLFGLHARYDSINNGRVMSATSTDYSHPLSKELPVHTVNVSLRNIDMEFDPTLKSGISKYLANRQLVKYSWGFTTSYGTVEWTPALYYFMDSFSVPEDQRNVELKTTSRLALLTDNVGNVAYDATEKTFYDIAQSVLSNAKILRVGKENPWVLSETLKQYHTNAPMPDEAVNTILQYLANASGLYLYTNPVNGYIVLSEFTEAGDQSVDLMQEQGDPKVEIQNTLRTITIGIITYTKNTQAGKVEVGNVKQKYKGNNTIQIAFSTQYAVEVTCSISGAALVEFTAYSTYAVVEFNAPATETEVSITLSGYEVVKNESFIETYNNKSVSVGLDVTIENPFITNTEQLQSLTDKLVAWYSKPQQLSLPYLGYPELTAGDNISLNTIYGASDVNVISNEIDFDGGFNGTLEVR